jgi:hypothetical protein
MGECWVIMDLVPPTIMIINSLKFFSGTGQISTPINIVLLDDFCLSPFQLLFGQLQFLQMLLLEGALPIFFLNSGKTIFVKVADRCILMQ